jgi:hypothetical protein
MTGPAEIPGGDLRGSVQQSAADLCDVAARLSDDDVVAPGVARILARLSTELAEAAAVARAVPGDDDAPGSRPIPVRMLSSTAVRGLLRAVADALDIPAPASQQDELTFLRLRSDRAAEAIRALYAVLAHAGRTELDLAWTSASLRRALQQYPADSYEHAAGPDGAA